MNISTMPLNGGTRYFIMNDEGRNIAYFDSLAKAGLVMRYLQGANMPPDDCAHAIDIMGIFDRDAKTWAAERDAKRAERRERALAARAKKQPAQPPEMPVEAFEGVSPDSERTKADESGQNEVDFPC